MKYKKGDTIIVTVGKDKGKKGKIEELFPKLDAIVVPGINVFKRHMKQRDEKHPSGIIDRIKPIRVSKTALVCPACGKVTRIGSLVAKNEKVRICKKCGKKV